MAAYYGARKSSGPVIRSLSLSSRFHRHYSTHSPSFSSHSSSAFASTSTVTAARPASPTPVNLCKYPNPSLSFSICQPGSPTRCITISSRVGKPPSDAATSKKRTCMCSPTNHPGSFRCSLHKGRLSHDRVSNNLKTASCGSSGRLNMRRSAMKNSLVRIGTVEEDLVKRALVALIRPSSHHQRRSGEFQPVPSRLSVMSKD